MIDLYLLRELVTFQKYGTLAKTAQVLAVTQPTITRGMQKLEEELGVKLFVREPNKISLTKTGKYAAQEAQNILKVNAAYAQKVRNYALSESTITVDADAPGPLIILHSLKETRVKVQPKFILNDFEQLLLNRQFTCLFLNHPLKNKKIAAIYLGTEILAVHINEFSNLASHPAISFADLKNMTFLVIQDIGIWKNIIQERIPQAKFLYQENSNNFDEIRNNSIFPYFTTNMTTIDPQRVKQIANDRIQVKIKDKEAHQQFYACFLKENKKRLLPLIQRMQDQWAKIDD